MHYFLILLSFSYLVLEVVFNVHFVNIVFEDKMYLYQYLDLWGRHIASLGATIVFLRVIIAKVNKFVTPFLLISFYFSFFFAQEELLNYITNKTSMEEKQRQSGAFIVKKGVINEVTSVGNLSPDDFKSSADNKVFLSSLGFLGFGYPEYLPQNSKENVSLYSQILHKDMELNTGFHFDQFSETRRLRREIFRKYDVQYSNLNIRARNEGELAWAEKEKNESLFIKKYSGIKLMYEKEKEEIHKKHIMELVDNLMWVVSCNDLGCDETFRKKLEKSNAIMASKFNLKSVYPQNICKKTGSRGWSFRYITDSRDKTHQGVANKKNKNSYNGYSCFFDTRSYSKVVYKSLNQKFIDDFGTINFSYNKVDDFIANGELEKAIRTKIKNEYNISLPYNWKRHDRTTFEKYIEKAFSINGEKIIQKEIFKQTGYNIPPKLYLDDFYKDKEVLKMLEEKLGFFYTGKYDPFKINNEEKFKRFFKEKYKKESGHFYSEEIENNPSFVDITFKQTILPVLSISLSLTFGVINFAFVFTGTASLFSNKIKNNEFKISSFIVVLFFTIPFLFNNYYVEQEAFEILFESFKDKNILFAYYYKWFLNMETILIYYLNDSVMNLTFVGELLKEDISF